ncbi:MAG TPA: IS1595 family transposase [Methylomirabilota bacterium]|jgi:transposase-like protein|nr:IS1595 family transposase [Methylomirabilota bacterium]
MKREKPALDFVERAPAIQDEDTAREIFERLRWPNGPRCIKCGSVDVYRIASQPGSSTRKGVLRCRDCEQQFTVTVGTVFEDSHVSLGKWLAAVNMMASSKKGVSAHFLHRWLKVSYRTAWFMAHRLRYAATQEPLSGMLRGTVEIDETYIGGKPENRHIGSRRVVPKAAVVSLVERKGRVRSFPVKRVTGETLKGIIRKNVRQSAEIMTDANQIYRGLDTEFAGHEAVNHHSQEFVRGSAHTNSVEGFFSLLKRGIIGTYHHVSEDHLWRYLAEFDARYNGRKLTDGQRAAKLLRSAEGKRLTYKPLVNRG